MDLHPVFVHFPIAFLTIYSIMELARIKKLQSKNYWFYVKAIVVIIGFIGSLLALLTGLSAEQNFPRDFPERMVVSVHQFWAYASASIYGFVSLLYAISWADRENFVKNPNKFWNVLLKIKSIFLDFWFVIILSLCGLAAITITGALGGAIVYGADADPFVSFVYKLFFK